MAKKKKAAAKAAPETPVDSHHVDEVDYEPAPSDEEESRGATGEAPFVASRHFYRSRRWVRRRTLLQPGVSSTLRRTRREIVASCKSNLGYPNPSYRAVVFFFFFFILRRMGKNKALAHHTSTYFHTRRCVDLTQLHSQPNASWRTLRVPL